MTDKPREGAMIKCADWFHLWNIHGRCQRCGISEEEFLKAKRSNYDLTE